MAFSQMRRPSAGSVHSASRSPERPSVATPSTPRVHRFASGGEAKSTFRNAYFGAGQAVDSGVRTHVEQATGRDLGGARMHVGEASAAAASSIGASAFTV